MKITKTFPMKHRRVNSIIIVIRLFIDTSTFIIQLQRLRMMAFLAGMLVSLSLAVSVGPGLALQFQACVQRGFTAGMAVVSARYLSDIALLCMSYVGILQVITSSRNQFYCGIAGSIACIAFGLTFILKKGNFTFSPVDLPTYKSPKSFFSYFFASLAINTMNPFVALFWIGLVALANGNFGIHAPNFFYFFSGLLSTALMFDITKCILFSQIKLRLKPRYFRWINRLTGYALILAGFLLLGKMLLP
jgi:threonine/homoserine/homoserine lactone efflux protein